MESGKELPFDGLFGAMLELRIRKARSGGNDVFVVDVLPSQEFSSSIMEPIKRGIARNNAAAMSIGGSSMSLLQSASVGLIEKKDESAYSEQVDDPSQDVGFNDDPLDSPVPLDIDDEKSIATQFGFAEADSVKDDGVNPAEALLSE
jgi:hypothetical protein